MPPKPLSEDVAIASANTPVNLLALFEGANPFSTGKNANAPVADEVEGANPFSTGENANAPVADEDF